MTPNQLLPGGRRQCGDGAGDIDVAADVSGQKDCQAVVADNDKCKFAHHEPGSDPIVEGSILLLEPIIICTMCWDLCVWGGSHVGPHKSILNGSDTLLFGNDIFLIGNDDLILLLWHDKRDRLKAVGTNFKRTNRRTLLGVLGKPTGHFNLAGSTPPSREGSRVFFFRPGHFRPRWELSVRALDKCSTV